MSSPDGGGSSAPKSPTCKLRTNGSVAEPEERLKPARTCPAPARPTRTIHAHDVVTRLTKSDTVSKDSKKAKRKSLSISAANKQNGSDPPVEANGTPTTLAAEPDEPVPVPAPAAPQPDNEAAVITEEPAEADAVGEGAAGSKPNATVRRASDAPASARRKSSTMKAKSRTGSKAESSALESPNGETTSVRLDALAQERSALRDEVASLRRSLEEIQEKHQDELTKVREELQEEQSEKEKAETNYQTLRDRVGTIKSQLGERLKADAEELSQCRTQIEELEEEKANLISQNEAHEDEITKLSDQLEEQTKEVSSLRSRSTLSSQNWNREKEEHLERETNLKTEFESAKQAMQDWEILAMEERSIRENLSERVADLEEQVTTHREARERLESERDGQSQTVDGLQRALQELQEARKKELREVVENSNVQVEGLRKELEAAEATAQAATKDKESAAKELERLQPLEAEIKEKNLLIGKLRHQAVGLNEHLTKALRQLKKGNPEENVDRELVTNHFLHFLSLDRSDARKFQVLEIIAATLNWSNEQREQAGLARPGATNPSLRTPISPWNRSPSTPSLAGDAAAAGLPERGRQDSLGFNVGDLLEGDSTLSSSQHSRSGSGNQPGPMG